MAPKPDATPAAIDRDVALLENAIASTGKSVRAFAHDVLARDDRTVRKWLERRTTLPKYVREKCYQVVRSAKRRARDLGVAAVAVVFSVYASAYCAHPRPMHVIRFDNGVDTSVAGARARARADTAAAPWRTADGKHCVMMHLPDTGGPVLGCPIQQVPVP